MQETPDSLREAICCAVAKMKTPPAFQEVEKVLWETLSDLCKRGNIRLGDDYTLGGFALECRVRSIFEEVGLDITSGRPALEDFVAQPPPGLSGSFPIVVEVKSSKGSTIGRDELRQLDDWVFDLSGEEKIRKRSPGLRLCRPNTAYVTAGWPPGPDAHPTPHKGVMVFNGPVGTPFNERQERCMDGNNREFVQKRNFCLIPFQVLLEWRKTCVQDPRKLGQFWQAICDTAGILAGPAAGLIDCH